MQKNKIKIYIDFANLIMRCKQDNMEISFEKLYVYLSDKYKTGEIYLFSGYFKDKQQEYEKNISIGFRYVFKEIIWSKEESKIKANCDVDISIKCVQDFYEEDVSSCILVTSDGDFASLIKFWSSKNIKVKIISPANPDKCSYLLKQTNVPITYLKQIVGFFRNEKALNEDVTS